VTGARRPDWDAVPCSRDTGIAASEPEPGAATGSGAWPTAGRPASQEPPAKQERHSHRAAKHGRPSRWRGSGNRPTGTASPDASPRPARRRAARVAVLFAVAWATRPAAGGATVRSGQMAAVTSITRSCPPSAPGSAAARISMVALPSQAATAGSGAGTPAGAATFSAVLAAPSPAKTAAPAAGKTKGTQPVTVSTPGAVAAVTAPGGGGTAVAATGKMAEGFEAEQSDASGTGVVSCTHPGSDMWFVGTGQAAGAARVWLYLMNTGNLTASADVTIIPTPASKID